MANVKSKNIQVFPSARRVNYQRTARLFSEKNLTSIVNQLLNVYGFVITKPDNYIISDANNTPFEFNIAGYYFRVESVQDILDAVEYKNANTGDIICASITLNTVEDVSSEVGTFIELDGQDDIDNSQSTYSGVNFTLINKDADKPSLKPTVADDKITYNLILLVCTGNSDAWMIYPESTIKFDQSSIRRINCGTITPTTKNGDYQSDIMQVSADYSYISYPDTAVPLYISEEQPEMGQNSEGAWIDV